MIKVAIANDTLIALEALRRVIATDSTYRLIWTARDGAEAVAKARRNQPDLILMDLLMPKMDGVEATRQIMAHAPCAILIVTGSVQSNTSRVFEAMGCGALDVVQTPTVLPRFSAPPPAHNATRPSSDQLSNGIETGLKTGSETGLKTGLKTGRELSVVAQPLLAKMVTVSKFIGKYDRFADHLSADAKLGRLAAPERSLIVIGASTGGPKAIAKILSQLPQSLSAAVVIAQHIDPQFVDGLATWLSGQSTLPVSVAKAGDSPTPGKVLLAGAHGHLAMQHSRTFTYLSPESQEAVGTIYRPSVDVLFKSVAQYWRSPGQAVLLTGMGKDGASGLNALRSAGWRTIAESQQSCVVYGMPKAAVDIGAAEKILDCGAIAAALTGAT